MLDYRRKDYSFNRGNCVWDFTAERSEVKSHAPARLITAAMKHVDELDDGCSRVAYGCHPKETSALHSRSIDHIWLRRSQSRNNHFQDREVRMKPSLAETFCGAVAGAIRIGVVLNWESQHVSSS